MASRALWKGTLKLSLVTIPIRVFAATDPSGEVSFRQLHKKCGTPIQLKKWCPHCEEDVSNDAITKGYEVHKGEFVVIDPEDIESVRPPSTHIIDITQVVDAGEIDPMYVERPYYIAPDGAGAGASYAVMRDALADRAGVGKVALHGREYLVALRPRDRGMVMYTLRHGDEIRSMKNIEELDWAKSQAKPAEMTLARKILDSFESEKPLTEYHDDYEDALRKMIGAKVAGREIVAPKEERPAKVVNLMDALRKSLDEVSARKKKPAKSTQRVTRAASGRPGHRRRTA
jgi:DNA end-binding protein Ku